MALQASLFRGDRKLEAAAVSDPDHILTGAAGPHVHKIQLALKLLDNASIAENEFVATVYGSSTAAAVLAYKQQRKIINFSYQTKADNIVGKMTMTTLDREMLAKEATLGRRPRIQPIVPPPQESPRGGGLLLASKFGVGPQNQTVPRIIVPGSTNFTMTIPVNGIGIFAVIDGVGADVFSENDPIAQISNSSQTGGRIPVVTSPDSFNVRGRRPGEADISAVNEFFTGFPFADVMTVIVTKDVQAPSRFVSDNGTPINPKGGGKKINFFGEGETPGFEDVSSEAEHAKGNNGKIRPVTSAQPRPPGIPNETASDICLRDSPISKITLREMGRVAQPKCRLTIALTFRGSGGVEGADRELKKVRRAFPTAEEVEPERLIPFRKSLVLAITGPAVLDDDEK